jgi:dUTP pyrophosphatase|tara:strand:- start:32 stop:505 length:474 start_codon:yes stop_codon:yes gene_type:complete
MILEFTKVEESAITPTRGNPSDAGLDLYAHLEASPIAIRSGENKMIPTGLRFGIPHGYMLQVCNRGSMGAKRSLVVGAHIVDSGYDGEVFIDLHNIGMGTQTIHNGEKIAQVVLVPVVHFRPRENKEGNLYEKQGLTISDRGDGALGSTDARQGVLL